MEESNLLKYIKYYLVVECDKCRKWDADEVLAEAGACLFPVADKLEEINDKKIEDKYGTLSDFKEVLNVFIGTYDLSGYSRSGLVSCLKANLKCKDGQKLLESMKLSFLTESRKDAIREKREDNYKKCYKKDADEVEPLLGPYGQYEYDDKKPLIEKKPAKKKGKFQACETENSKAISDFDSFWKEKALPESLSEGEYFWEKRIPFDTYSEIKEKLKELPLKELIKNHNIKKNKTQSLFFYIACYLAEWFKWEYNGNKGNNGLAEIGLTTNDIHQNFWEMSNLPESYLYQTKTDEFTEGEKNENGTNRRLFSMYVLGGFPFHYICETDRSQSISIFKYIWRINKNQESELDEDAVDDMAKILDKNVVYSKSIKNKASLYEWIKTITDNGSDDGIPVAEADKERDVCKKMKELLECGKKDYYDTCFAPQWSFFMEPDNVETCYCQLRVKVGFLKDEGYISSDCMLHFLGEVPDVVDLQIQMETEEDADQSEIKMTSIRFFRTSGPRSSFVGEGNYCYLSAEMPLSLLPLDFHIVAKTPENNLKKIKEIKCKKYFQLFETDTPYKWADRTDRTANVSLLYFSPEYRLSDDKFGTTWKWIRQECDLSLCGKEGTETVQYRQGKLEIVLDKLPKNLTPVDTSAGVDYWEKNEDGDMENSKLPLLLGCNGFKVSYCKPDDEKTVDVDVSACKYKKENDKEYNSFDEKKPPETGKLNLRVSYGGIERKMEVFFIPNDSKPLLKRNCSKKRLESPLGEMKAGDPSGTFVSFEKEGQEYFYSDVKYPHETDEVPVRIGGDSKYVELKIYRAMNIEKEVYIQRKNDLIKLDNITEIPFILRDKVEVRFINEKEGVERKNCDENKFVDFQKDPRNNYAPLYEDAELKIYAFHKPKSTKYEETCAPEETSQYVFYYADLFHPEKEPKMITASYDEENDVLSLPTKYKKLDSGTIIFQSLKDVVPARYLCPMYPNGNWDFLTNKGYKYQQKDVRNNCFEIASQHHVCFHQFYPLVHLSKYINNMFEFLNDYFEKELTEEDYASLHRFANEFLFDWMLLPLKNWQNLKKKNEKKIDKLFMTSPFVRTETDKNYMKDVLNKYWNLKEENLRLSGKETEKDFIKCIRAGKGKTNSLSLLPYNQNNTDEIIDMLQKIHADHKFCMDLYTGLNNKDI
jgi:hypothetical protein